MDTPDGGARVLVSRRGDCTGIQDDDLCLAWLWGPLQPPAGKLPLDGGAVCLGSPAPKILYIKAGHPYIVAYKAYGPRVSECC